jgi:hypothetical protein
MDDKLSDGGEVLFRQIHPTFYQNGEPSSQPFMPTPKDQNKLSVDRSALTTAATAHALFTANGHESVAVYGISVGEFGSEALECASDPLDATEDQQANPAHAIADYSPHGGSKQKTIAKRLKIKALARGCLHSTE